MGGFFLNQDFKEALSEKCGDADVADLHVVSIEIFELANRLWRLLDLQGINVKIDTLHPLVDIYDEIGAAAAALEARRPKMRCHSNKEVVRQFLAYGRSQRDDLALTRVADIVEKECKSHEKDILKLVEDFDITETLSKKLDGIDHWKHWETPISQVLEMKSIALLLAKINEWDQIRATIVEYEGKTKPLVPASTKDAVQSGRDVMAACNVIQSFFKTIPKNQSGAQTSSRAGLISQATKKLSKPNLLPEKVREATKTLTGAKDSTGTD